MTAPGLIVPDWAAPARVRAVMTTREGGVSAGPWRALNLGVHVGDDPAAVLENRARVRRAASLPSEPVWLEQVHGTTVVVLDAPEFPAPNLSRAPASRGESPTGDPCTATLSVRPRADASVATRAGIVCAIQVADCMPVLFAAQDGSAVGAAHAGWRGLAGGVLAATVEALRTPPHELLAWLGPAIGPEHFEVGDDVVDAFVRTAAPEHLASTRAAFILEPDGKWLCDLYALARLRLNDLGVTRIAGGGGCTVSEPGRFFSYRRDGRTGRMAALVWLDPGPA